ncbi:hypothetical protein BC940DRAFT_228671, partial [Gongronella butleri]
ELAASVQALVTKTTKLENELAEISALKVRLEAAEKLTDELREQNAQLQRENARLRAAPPQHPSPAPGPRAPGPSGTSQATPSPAPSTQEAARPLNATQNTWLTVAKRGRRHGKTSTRQPPTPNQLEWAARGFQPIDESFESGFTILYFKSPSGARHNQVRDRLRILGIAQSRVLDIHFPTRGVVGFLVHREYAKALIATFAEKKITPIAFDPCDASVIVDPKYDTTTPSDRA